MHILLTGGTGLIGRHLCQLWLGQGHRLTVWSRQPEQVPKLCGSQVRGIARLEELEADDPLPIGPGPVPGATCCGPAGSP